MDLKSYIKIARIDHWFKNIFMLPGIFFAISKTENINISIIYNIILAIISICLAASANYVLNEYLDAEFDRFHPVKKNRPLVQNKLDTRIIIIQYICLLAISLYIANILNIYYLCVTVFFLIMGVVYNVKPLRTKDLPYLDVLSESINNPIRLILGWLCIVKDDLNIPISLIFGYWMAGAFLMSLKRYAELRSIGIEKGCLYRKSFKFYNEKILLMSSLYYAMTSTLFLGVFLIKYNIGLIFSFPFVSLLFVWYFGIGLEKNSVVQTPEKLFQSKLFLIYVLFLVILLYIITKYEFSILNVFI